MKSKKQIGYLVRTRGTVGSLEKLYTNAEDAEEHYQWQAKNPFALHVEMFRCNYEILQSMKERTEAEKPEHEGSIMMEVPQNEESDAAVEVEGSEHDATDSGTDVLHGETPDRG